MKALETSVFFIRLARTPSVMNDTSSQNHPPSPSSSIHHTTQQQQHLVLTMLSTARRLLLTTSSSRRRCIGSPFATSWMKAAAVRSNDCRLVTTAAAAATRETNQPQEELVQVLRLNMLQDNPGAVKKVSYGEGSSG